MATSRQPYQVDYFDHLERFLGRSRSVYGPAIGTGSRPYQLLRFDGVPTADASTLTTAGLARHTLSQPSGRAVRQEFVLAVYTDALARGLPATLDLIVRECLERHRPLLRGEVLGPRGPVAEGSRLEAFVSCSPWFWDDEFSLFAGTDPPTYLVLLLPIDAGEATFIRNRGIDAFERLVEEADPDLLSLDRPSCLPTNASR